MMSLSYVYGVDGLQRENKKETEEKLVDFFFTLTKYGREDVWKSVIVLVCGCHGFLFSTGKIDLF